MTLGLAFAKAGYHIIAVARTVGGLEALDDQIKAATGQDATLVPLDLRDSDAIDRMGGALHQRFGKTVNPLVLRHKGSAIMNPLNRQRVQGMLQLTVHELLCMVIDI